MGKNFAKKLAVSALVGAFSLCTAFGIALSGTAKAAEETDYSTVGGISVVATGTEGESNASLYVNLSEVTALTDVKSVIFDITLDADNYFTPLLVDANGNYYEYMGAGDKTGQYKTARTLSSLSSVSSTNASSWFGLYPDGGRGMAGRAYYSFELDNWYMRANLDNYGNSAKDLTLAKAQGSSLAQTQSLKTVGFRTEKVTHKNTNLVFGDVYLEKTDGTVTRVLDSSEVEISEGLKYNYTGNYAWGGYVGNFGSFDSEKACTQCGWLNGMTESVWSVETVDGGVGGYFEGVNYRQTLIDDTAQYQRLQTQKYAAGFAGKTIIAQYYDRGGEGCIFEPQIMNDGGNYILNGATAYFVDMNYNLVGSQKLSWSITPPAGFVGYIVFDVAGIANANYLALQSHLNEALSFGFHGNWNGGKLVNADFGTVTIAEGGLSASTDFKMLINGAAAFECFTSATALDGLGDFELTVPSNYGLVINKVMKSYDYKSTAEVVYGRVDGLNFQISNPEDQEYHYLYVNGNTSDLTDTAYFSIRIADHAFNAGKFEFFFYDAAKTFQTRSGINQAKEVYLFNKDGSFNKAIYPENAWSWVELPAGFDGYMVIPTASIDWLISKDKAANAVIISQGSQGISNTQQGTLDTPTSSGFNIEFGKMSLIKGALNADKSNLLELLNSATLYAELLNSSRTGYTANVSGATQMFTPVVSSALDYTYVPTEGAALDGKDAAGSATLNAAIPTNAERLAFYVYNESMETMELDISFDNGEKPTKATLVSVIDDVSELTLTDGKVSLPDGFEGYLIVDYKGGKPVFTLDEGERLCIKDIFVLTAGAKVENASDVFNQSITLLRTVTASDAELTAAIGVTGIELKRAVASYYLTPDAPTNFEDDSVIAKVALNAGDDNYIFCVKDTYAAFKSPEMYEGTPTINLGRAPALIKNNVKYILFDEGETVTATIEESGVIYVFAGKSFAGEGFKKTMAMESFIDGVDDRLFLYEKAFEEGETLSVQGAYMIIVDGEESEDIFRTVAAKAIYFDDIPDEYIIEKNWLFMGTPVLEIMPSGRIYVGGMTGGRTEPVIENCVIYYYSDDNGKTFNPYFIVDHPYETMGRTFDNQLWYVDGKLWAFWAQADKVFGSGKIRVFGMYSENPDAENIKDVVWSEPISLLDGLMNSKPVKLSDGSYIYNSNQPEKNAGIVNIYKSTDKGMTATKIGEAAANPASQMVFTEGKIVELPNGTLWLLKRVDGTEDRTEQSFSTDGGKTWTVGSYNETLLCGSSRFVFTKLPSGNLLYVGCVGRNRNRSNMTAMLSTDNGQTWQYSLELDHRTWVSYPDFAYLPDGKIMIMYDKGRTTHMEYRYAILTEADIMAGKIVTEGCSIMNIAFKNPKYMEIEKVFALPKATYDQAADKNVVVFPEGTTRAQVVKAFPAEGVSVGLNTGELKQLLGGWTLGSINADGYGTITFVPTGGLPWNIEDTYRLLEITVKIEKTVAEATVTGIEITSEPTKKTYTLGEALDLEGLVVVEKYSDGTSKLLERSEYAVSDLDSMTAGEKTITVSKDGFSATFKVTVQSGSTGGTGSGENGGNGGSQGGEQGGKEKKGCGSCGGSVSGAVLAMLTLLSAGVILKKKTR
ncbi:MAG: bacterial Ig-like domain-containing protein [Clostridia bacterium]|nr:bacterial Ig-like domain-containing protein [Clostridia bacterium]